MNSIGRRLQTLLLGGFLFVGILACAAVYLIARDEFDELFDYQLVQVANALFRQGVVPLPSSISHEDEAKLVVSVWKDGKLVYADPPGIRLHPPRGAGFLDLPVGGSTWRAFVLRTDDRIIQVSQPIAARRDISFNFSVHAVTPLLVAFPIFAFFIWLSVRIGMSPLNRIAEDVGRRSPSQLKPLPIDGLPSEILPLATHLNYFMARLSDALERQKRFVADAAHELRTPLAVIALQLRILERSTGEDKSGEAIDRLRDGIRRAAHMVAQLLVLARLEPESPKAFSKLRLDIASGEVVAEHARIAEQRGVDLGMIEGEPVTVVGEVESLRAMIANLVDNAVRYTKAGGAVDVRVGRSDAGAFVEVVDNGPGIPPGERERVFERFYRCTRSGESGSGLGLAIVKSAVERHGGTITLDQGPDGKGLRVVVQLPALPAVIEDRTGSFPPT